MLVTFLVFSSNTCWRKHFFSINSALWRDYYKETMERVYIWEEIIRNNLQIVTRNNQELWNVIVILPELWIFCWVKDYSRQTGVFEEGVWNKIWCYCQRIPKSAEKKYFLPRKSPPQWRVYRSQVIFFEIFLDLLVF